jgi:hypothetical protein
VSDQIIFWNYPVHPDTLLKYYGTYIADTWTMRRLSLNLGLRHAYDTAKSGAACREAADPPSNVIFPAECFDEVEQTAYNTWAPRIRAAFDLSGTGKTVIKGGWGRYQQMRYADQVDMVAKNVIYSAYYRWRDLNQNANYDAGEVNLNPNGSDFLFFEAVRGVLLGAVPNPDEKAPYTDEYMVQFEQQLTSTLAIRATGVERRYGNAHRLLNELRPYEAYNIPYTNRDPGPDGRLNTADDGGLITYYDYPNNLVGAQNLRLKLVNDDSANEAYHTFEVSLTKRFANRWQFFISHSATKQDIPMTATGAGVPDFNPNAEINTGINTWESMTRASGSYQFPWGILTSANFERRSGDPLARTARFANGANVGSQTLRVEEAGAITLPDINLLTLRFEKRFGLPRSQQVAIRMNVYNALNTDVATGMTVASGANFGRVTSRVLPRIIDFQGEYRF